MAERFDLDAIEADDALLDLLAAGAETTRAAGESDPAARLLAELRLAVEVEDELPVETIDDPETFLARCAALNPVTDPFTRKMATRGLAVGVAAVAALSVSGVAAAVTGDPLSPYEKVIEKVVDGLRPPSSIPKEELNGMPVFDKTKIVKVAKDFQHKQQLEEETRQARGEDGTVLPIMIQEENRLAPKPPLLNRLLPPPEEKPTVVKAEPRQPEVTEPVQPIDDGKDGADGGDGKDGTDKPVAPPTGEPTEPTEPTTEPSAKPTTEPTDPATTTTPPPVDPTQPTPTPTPTPTQQPNQDPGTETGTGSTGNPTTTPTPGSGSTQKPDGEPTTVPSDGGSQETPAPGDDNGSGTGGDEARDEVKPDPVLPTPTGAPVEVPAEVAQFFKQAQARAKHSNGSTVTGSVKSSYAKGKHSSGRYAEGRHAAIHRTHGSVASPNVLRILGLLNTPMD